MRHQAWLNATPKEQDKTRRELYTEGSPYLVMTPLSAYEQHLIELWHECGTVSQGAGGILPLDWGAIITWANKFYSEEYIEWLEHPRASNRHKRVFTPIHRTQCTLLDYELQLIRNLSEEYSGEYSCASDPQRECPKVVYVEDVTEDEALANADSIAEAFKNMFGNGDTST